MAKPKNEKTDAGVDLDALDSKLAEWSARIGVDVGEMVDKKLSALHKDLDLLRDDLDAVAQGRDLHDHDDDDDGDFDEDDPDTFPEVREARRLLGRECPKDIGEIAAALRKRGQRLRLDGLRYATAADMGTGRTMARPVARRGAGAVRMSGEANKVRDHTGKVVAQGQRGRRR